MLSGELARRAGISPDTLRHYERLGLLPVLYLWASSAPSMKTWCIERSSMRFGRRVKSAHEEHGAEVRDLPCYTSHATGTVLVLLTWRDNAD
ncbi:MAG: MerR family DNA-binding transcriptional regulator [Candidatus Polarisedimenticolia bacterium]